MQTPKSNLKMQFLIAGLVIVFNVGVHAQARIPTSLRQGINADEATIAIALELQAQGWSYIMPQPKSPQAGWGNTDGRTTWFLGYWVNKNTDETSLSIPQKVGDTYAGDGKGGVAWRRGGTPPPPSKLEWLLSAFGGIKPVD